MNCTCSADWTDGTGLCEECGLVRIQPDSYDPFAVPDRTPEAIAQDDRQAADPYSDARYYDALVVIANEQGAGRYARAINLVAKIWGKTPEEVLGDAVML